MSFRISANGQEPGLNGFTDNEINEMCSFLQGAVYCWCKNRKDEWFVARDLIGGDNYFWEGTPLMRLYEYYLNDEQDNGEYAVEEAGKAAGRLLKKVLFYLKKLFFGSPGEHVYVDSKECPQSLIFYDRGCSTVITDVPTDFAEFPKSLDVVWQKVMVASRLNSEEGHYVPRSWSSLSLEHIIQSDSQEETLSVMSYSDAIDCKNRRNVSDAELKNYLGKIIEGIQNNPFPDIFISTEFKYNGLRYSLSRSDYSSAISISFGVGEYGNTIISNVEDALAYINAVESSKIVYVKKRKLLPYIANYVSEKPVDAESSTLR